MTDPIVGYIAASLMGFVLGMLGGGGAILTVPILVYLCGATAWLASSYSLWIVGVTAAVGAVRYARANSISYRVAIRFGLPSIAGVVLARGFLLPRLPEELLTVGSLEINRDLLILILFAALMVVAGGVMIRSSTRETQLSNRQGRRLVGARDYSLLVVEGLLVGVLTGIVGAGGGFIIVPVLVVMLGLPMHTAIGTSLMIISVKSLIGVLADSFFWSHANIRFLLFFTSASILGIWLGSAAAKKVSTRPLKVGFGWLSMLIGITMITKELLL